jgi:hypothetical protein
MAVLVESWQFNQVVARNPFHGLTRLAPGAEAAGDNEDFES